MYGSEATRWLATRHEVTVEGAETTSFPALTRAVAAAISGVA
jgi:hypothetical protein